MGCGKSSKLVTPAFVEPVERKEPTVITDTHGSQLTPVIVKPNAVQAPKQSSKPIRNSDLAALYPPALGKPRLRLEYVYGYRCGLSRNNVFYLSASDIIVYPCGSMAVLLSVSSNTQRFLGGGEVHSLRGHFDDVVSVAVNREKDVIATGEIAELPVICIWKLPSIDPQTTIQLGEGTKGVDILAFSSDSHLLAAVDMGPEQTVRVFQTQSGTQLFASSGKMAKVRALAWSPKAAVFCSAGDACVHFWTSSGSAFSKVKGEVSPSEVAMNCVRWTSSGECITGGVDGKIYVWTESHLTGSFQILAFHTPVTALCVYEGNVLVGGKDGRIHILNQKYSEERLVDTPGAPTSLDMSANGIVCGTEEGILVEFGKNGRVILMDVHAGGVFSGLAVDPKTPTRMVTVGGDNKIKSWDLSLRKCVVSGLMEVAPTPTPARALAVSPNGHVAVGHSDGHFTIRTSPHQLNNIRQLKRDPKSAITVMRFAPNGCLLAVGTESGAVQVFAARTNYGLAQELRAHSGEIVALDWNVESTTLRSQDRTLVVNWWKAESGEKLSELASEKWVTDTIFHLSPSGFPSLSAARAHKVDAVVQGTASGVIELTSPVGGMQVSAYKAHAGPIKCLLWAQEDDSVFSAGASDMCIMQWKLA